MIHIAGGKMIKPLRLYFPLFTVNQLTCGITRPYTAEINKLRQFSCSIRGDVKHDRIPSTDLPIHIHIIFYSNRENNINNYLFIGNKIIEILEQEVIIQSLDTRCVNRFTVEVKPATLLEREGCLIQFFKD